MKQLILLFLSYTLTFSLFGQPLKSSGVPTLVKDSLKAQFPAAKNVTWEREDGNYEANWGGKSGEANSVQFSPAGAFIEIVRAISVTHLADSDY